MVSNMTRKKAPSLRITSAPQSLESALLAALDNPDRELRREAIEAAAHFVDPDDLVARVGEPADANRRNAALEALMRSGSRGVPAVIRALSDPDDEVVMFAAGILGKSRDPAAVPHLVALLDYADVNVVQQAIESIAQLRSSVAVDSLVRLLDRDPWLRFSAVHALGEIGDQRAVDPLLTLVGDDTVSEVVVEAIGKIGTPEALGHLARILKETESTELFQACLRAIGHILEHQIDADQIESVSGFARLAAADASVVHMRVMSVLSTQTEDVSGEERELRGAAVEIVRALKLRPLYTTLVMAGRDPGLRDVLRYCAVSIGGDLAPSLALGLTAANANVRALACDCLAALGDVGSLAQIRKLLRDPDPRVRTAAISALGRFDDESVVGDVVRLLGDIAKDVRLAAQAMLVRTSSHLTAAPLLQSARLDVAKSVALGVMAAAPHPSYVPFIRACLKDEEGDVRAAAARAIMAQPGVDAIAAIEPLIRDADRDVREKVIALLGTSRDRRARELLLAQLDSDPDTLSTAVRSLADLRDAVVAPHLISLYSRADPLVRVAIIEALSQLREITAEPMLVRLLSDGDVDIRRSAVRALGKYATRTAIRHVLAAARDPSWEVRVAAIEVLSQDDQPGARAAVERLCLDESIEVAVAARRYLEGQPV
jgi:HEAT repeat protein